MNLPSKRAQFLSVLVIIVALSLLAFFTTPKKQSLGSEEILAYAIQGDDEKEVNLTLEIFPSHATWLSDIRHSVTLTYEDESYYYHHENNLEREESYLPLTKESTTFGVLLPDEDFSEMILIFSDDLDYLKDETLYVTSFPQKSKEQTLSLLRLLLEKNDYDLTERHTH